jgi:uncharacterized protein (TIGR00255 family)
MRSMTGHGRGTAEGGGHRVTVEIRSVNHRFLEVKLRSATLDARAEEAVNAAIRKRAERGAFTVTIRDESARAALHVNLDVARSTHAALEELRLALGYTEPTPLAVLLAQPGVVTAGEAADGEALIPALTSAVEAALVALVAMRNREGEALAADVLSRVSRLETLGDEIREHANVAPGQLRQRLEERLAKLTAGTVTIDETRLAAEVALLADKADVTEELTRLRAHLEALRSIGAQDAAVGRRLDFLVQEIGRELNTIGSKSPSVDITRRVVEGKAELERIREQIQNVE